MEGRDQGGDSAHKLWRHSAGPWAWWLISGRAVKEREVPGWFLVFSWQTGAGCAASRCAGGWWVQKQTGVITHGWKSKTPVSSLFSFKVCLAQVWASHWLLVYAADASPGAALTFLLATPIASLPLCSFCPSLLYCSEATPGRAGFTPLARLFILLLFAQCN